jgi:ASC-1-like (ASCH) protein
MLDFSFLKAINLCGASGVQGALPMRTMHIKQKFLGQIRTGEKTLEIRVGYQNIRSIQPGELIRIASSDDELIVRVIAKREYKNHLETLAHEDFHKIVPQIPSKGDLLKVLCEIYPPHKEALGVIVLNIEKAS